MKGVIIYKGKYGATRQYAAWLRNKLPLHIVQADNCKKYQVEESDIIVIGTSIYTGKMLISKWLKKHVDVLRHKKIFLFAVCATASDETQKLQEYIASSVPAELLHQCKVYFLPGRLVYKNLSVPDKFILRMGAMMAKDAETKKTMLTDFNSLKEENLDELVSDIKRAAAITTVSEPVLQQY